MRRSVIRFVPAVVAGRVCLVALGAPLGAGAFAVVCEAATAGAAPQAG